VLPGADHTLTPDERAQPLGWIAVLGCYLNLLAEGCVKSLRAS
jgi:hypothetical protein